MKKKELRKIKPKKSKKKVLLILVIILLLGVGGYFTYNFLKNPKDEKINVKILDSIEKYGYYVDDRDSKLYKEEFNKLKEVLNAKELDTEKYSEYVARLFVIDLYSLNSKINKYDVGGKAFFNSTKEEMFKTKVMDTLYSTMQDDSYGKRTQELPEVSSVETVSINEDSYIFIEQLDNNTCPEEFTKNNNGKCVKEVEKVYVVELKWKYTKDMGYDDEGSIVVAPDTNNKWSVVEYKPKLGAFA